MRWRRGAEEAVGHSLVGVRTGSKFVRSIWMPSEEEHWRPEVNVMLKTT